ncbi:MAG: hypothetical protein GTN64_07970 [Candidatus Latescibacteria bacterium]|nr:hypothetical protein [Candidatus Latescibacterota bacterium]NIO78540.1 hypothetical protein [Candidatus Latescibacterota bacterium]
MKLLFVSLLIFTFIPPAPASSADEVFLVKAFTAPDSHRGLPLKRVYVSSTTASEIRLLELRDKLIKMGAKKVNFFVPSLLVFEMPPDPGIESLLTAPDLQVTEEMQISRVVPNEKAFSPAWVKGCYQQAARIHQRSISPLPRDAFRRSFRDTVVVISEAHAKRIQAALLEEMGVTDEKNVNQNSEFMIGDILVQLIFPESNGAMEKDTEEWSNAELSAATSGAVSAMLHFQTEYSYLPMNYVFNVLERVPTRFEPISHNMGDDHVWIKDVMMSLGYTLDDPAGAVHAFNNDGKKRYGTDWVFTAFTANSENSPLHRFKDAFYTAYAFLGGPYLVMPFPAGENPFYIDEVLLYSQIFQHETAHIFWALDEYPTAPGMCGDHSGYLDIYNKNKLWYGPDGQLASCQDTVPCTMINAKEDVGKPWCKYTSGQMGLSVSQSTGIPRVFDSLPIIEFERAGLETVQTDEFVIRLKAISTAVPNRNPSQLESERIDYAAPLKDATFNVDGVGKIKIFPEDGKWDETEEDLAVRLASLRAGLIQIGISVRNAFGRASPFYTKKVFNIGLNYAYFIIDEREEGVHIAWNMAGETFGASFDLHRIEPGPEQFDRIIAHDLAPSDTSNSQFLGFSYLDSDVKPGATYRYYVRGTFTLNVGGSPRTYTSDSIVFKATAMLPIAKGSILSYPSPNPFNPANGRLFLSIDIPGRFTPLGDVVTPSGESGVGPDLVPGAGEVGSQVDVYVYDVLGRRIKGLYSQKELSGVLTIPWDGTNDNNEPVPSGIYFFKVRAGAITETRKVLLIR